MVTTKSQIKKFTLSDIDSSSQSLLMQDIFDKILSLAQLDSNVILVGEIGLGKKRLSHTIHSNSKRAHGPFYSFYCVDVNEREYKDAFWGHLQFEENHITLKYEALEEAEGGTLYLDQFSELTIIQMLNLLESYLKGCNQLFRYNQKSKPRLIISMNQESYREILHQPIWEKLLSHLDPVVIMLPPLRERKEDIPILIDHFLEEIKKNNTEYVDLKISAQALYKCINYSWPGNIRQLKNAILQGAILSYGHAIKSEHLPFSMNWQLPYEIDGKNMTIKSGDSN
jgi:DNA-binding NtrC family response regulator